MCHTAFASIAEPVVRVLKQTWLLRAEMTARGRTSSGAAQDTDVEEIPMASGAARRRGRRAMLTRSRSAARPPRPPRDASALALAAAAAARRRRSRASEALRGLGEGLARSLAVRVRSRRSGRLSREAARRADRARALVGFFPARRSTMLPRSCSAA